LERALPDTTQEPWRFSDLRAGDRVPLTVGGMIGEPREVRLPSLAVRNEGGLIDAVEVLSFAHRGSIPLPEAFALVRCSGISFSRWWSCGVLSLTVYTGVWGIEVLAYLLSEERDFV
jgi:hypothetical protein